MNRNQKIFESESVWKSIFAMAVPSLITILVMLFYNMADMFFIGQLGNTSYVAAVSLVTPVFSMLMALASMIGAGGSVIISAALGGGDREKATGCSAACIWSAILLGAVLAVLLNVFKGGLLTFLGAREDTIGPASTYLSVLTLGAPFMMMCTACGTLVRAEGAVQASLFGNLAGTVTNILLDPLFILVFRWGTAGAAAATVIGNLLGAAFYIHFILRKSAAMSLSLQEALQNNAVMLEVIPLGIPNAVSTVLSGFASTFSNRILAGYSTMHIASVAASGKISMLITMVQMGICMGVQPLIAYHYGSGNKEKLNEVLKKTTLLTVIVGLCATVFCILFRHTLIGLFLKEPEAAELGSKYVLYLIAGSAFLGFYYISSGYLQATKHAAQATLVSTMRQGALLIPLLFVMNHFFGFFGIGIAHIAADIIAAAGAFILFLATHSKYLRKGAEL